MAHYAKVLDGLVIKVIVADPEFFETFVDSSPGEWIETSYNTKGGVYYTPNTSNPDADQSKALRKNFAGVGMLYNKEKDMFYGIKPYASWVLNDDTGLWEPPIAYPETTDSEEKIMYRWNEDTVSWDEVESD
jgi:hypothetical protein